MTASVRTTTCPLCSEALADHAALRDHLSGTHGLEDDEGYASTSDDSLIVGGSAAADEGAGRLGVRAVDQRRVFDPTADDERFRPIAIGVGGVLLTIVVFVVLLLTGVI
jgi:hypothetical protein